MRAGKRRSAVEAAVELTVRVAAIAVAPVTLTLEGIAQVGGSVAVAMLVVTTQLRLTVPVNPPEGVTVMVDVLPDAAPGATVMLPLSVRAMAGFAAGAVTVTVMLVLAVMVPVAASVPVTATVYAPGVVAAVVATATVPVTADELVMSRVEGTVQVAGLTAPVGPVTAQVRLMVPW